jgi:hypothetical protein
VAQIISCKISPEGNHVIEVKPLAEPKVSESGKTVIIAGTVGWAELIPGWYHEDADGDLHTCTCHVQIRYNREKKLKKKE